MPLTPEQIELLSPEEREAYDAAQESLNAQGAGAGAGAGDGDGDGDGAGAGDGDGNGAGQGDGVGAGQGDGPNPGVNAVIQSALRQAEADRLAREEQDRRAQSAQDEETRMLLELEALQYRDPIAYQKKLLDIATERASARARAEIEARYGDNLQRVHVREVEDELGRGLGEHGREYIRRYATKIGPTDLENPEIRDIVVRAARDYETEKAPRRQVVEASGGERGGGNPERAESDFWTRLAAERSGVDESKLRLSDTELAQARRGA